VRRRIFNRIGLAAIAGCVALGSLALAGCGGGGSSSTTGASGTSGAAGTTPLSQDEFVSQANAACKQYSDAAGALKQPASNSTSDVAAYTAQLLPLVNRAYAQLAALTPPSDLQAKYAQYLSDNKSQIGLLQDLEGAAKAGDASKASAAVQKLDAAKGQVDSEAQDLGLSCGAGVQPQG
jgi:hypothetical protein